MKKQEQPIIPAVCKTPRWQLLKGAINNLLPADFKDKMNGSNVVLLDVRTPEEFAVNPLPRAINIDYLGEGFWDKIEALDAEKTYLVYCRTGRRSLRTCTLMKNGGFANERVFNLDGGMVAWEARYGVA